MSSRPRIVARDAELARLASFVAGEMPSRALVLTGVPGIGKTTLWQAALAAAREHGVVVHAARPAEQEVQLAFTAIADLLDGVETTELAAVPAPQARALEIALFRADPQDEAAEPSAVAAGLTGTLRVLSEQGPRLVGIDDAPWLDQASAAALAFAARRLRDHPVRFLLTRRPGEPSAVEAAFGADQLACVDVGPISLGATRSMLAEQLGLQPPRRVLLRLFEVAQGNPLVALELGRLLAKHGGLEEELPRLGGDLFAWCVPASIPTIVITSGPPAVTAQTFAHFSFTGAIAVYIGAKQIGQISLAAASTSYQNLILLPRFSYSTATVAVKVVSSGKPVQLDGLAVSRS